MGKRREGGLPGGQVVWAGGRGVGEIGGKGDGDGGNKKLRCGQGDAERQRERDVYVAHRFCIACAPDNILSASLFVQRQKSVAHS